MKTLKTQLDQNTVALRAYHIWEKEGRPGGRDLEFWTRAQAEILEEHRLAEAPAAMPTPKRPASPRAKKQWASPDGNRKTAFAPCLS